MGNTLDFLHFKKGEYNINGFSSGIQECDQYVKQFMSQNETNNLSRNYVGVYDKELISILCLSSSIIKSTKETIPDKCFPDKMELPTIKIGRLVVDKRYRKQGYGEQTLKKAIAIFVEISKQVGVIGLTVDSKYESVGFYLQYGFKQLKSPVDKASVPLVLYTAVLKKQSPNLFKRV